jgi:hypothetical protein
MVIDDVTAHNPKHLCIGMMRKYAMVIDDVTAHVNPKHLYDETINQSINQVTYIAPQIRENISIQGRFTFSNVLFSQDRRENS